MMHKEKKKTKDWNEKKFKLFWQIEVDMFFKLYFSDFQKCYFPDQSMHLLRVTILYPFNQKLTMFRHTVPDRETCVICLFDSFKNYFEKKSSILYKLV